MNRTICPVLISLILLSTGIINMHAQKTSIYNQPDADFRIALELLNKEKFGSARSIFKQIREEYAGKRHDIITESRYYEALSAMELFNNDADNKLLAFIHDYPENSKTDQAWFQLGRFNYKNKNYKNALDAFSYVDVYHLNADEKAEYYFKTGYCQFTAKKNEPAKRSFFEIIDKESKYKAPANYFYAHIAYSEKNYETALLRFQRLINDIDFAAVVPYYITQIYYLQGKYEELLKVAPPLLDSANTRRAPEIARLIGEAYYKTGQFGKSVPYLEMYRDKTTNQITREDYYQLGYAYYRTQFNYKAIENFQKVVGQEDLLSQNAWHHLASCYLNTDQKSFARNAFLSAYKLNFDKDIKEDALFNYAKLSYELSINPYNEAIIAFQTFINDYPASTHLDDANTYLAELFMTTRNYKDALTSIEGIKIKSEKINEAWQKVSYFRGVELFNDNKAVSALPHFRRAAKMRYNTTYAALSLFWSGEIYYKTGKTDSALANYQSFLLAPGAFGLPEFNLAQYNIGYCYFKEKKYSQALIPFQKYLMVQGEENKEISNDVYKRIGDCYFMNKDLTSAITYYDKAIATKLAGTDYSMFQKAMALGVMTKFTEKARILEQLLADYPKSPYADDAFFEIADSYKTLNENKKAITYYTELIKQYPKSSYISKAKLHRGLLHFNMKEDEIALSELKEVVSEYPGSSESKEALMTIQDIYIYMNQVDEFLRYVKGFSSVSDIQEDSITYQAIELRYMKGDCDNSKKSFENYLKTFPEGVFAINAHFYKAECHYKAAELDQAIKGYDYVISKPRNKFTESALVKASAITFSRKNFSEALQYYSKLETVAEYDNNLIEARKGLMRCNFELNNFEEAIKSAEKLLSTPKVNEDKLLTDEANITIARSALMLNNIAKAQTMFTIVSRESKGESKAEAKYYLAEIQYSMKNYDESQKEIFEIINQVPSYDKWIAKAFILLADNYYETGNPFEAKQTLQAVIDNYKGTDLVEIAYMKLNAIIASEKQPEPGVLEEDFDLMPEDLPQE